MIIMNNIRLLSPLKALVIGLVMLGSTAAVTTAPAHAITTPPAQCGSGSGDATLSVVWNGSDTFTVTPKSPLKNDVKLFASSYILTNPDFKNVCFTYDPAFGTSPQVVFKTVVTVLPKGMSPYDTKVITVPMPDKCNNVQVDLYYGKDGQELTTVGQYGHDGYGNLAGNIVQPFSTTKCEVGRGSETPTTPQVLAATTVAKPELANTGTQTLVTSIVAGLLIALSAVVATRRATVKE
jgi:LPXTG-motif cell wall-anchored protein